MFLPLISVYFDSLQLSLTKPFSLYNLNSFVKFVSTYRSLLQICLQPTSICVTVSLATKWKLIINVIFTSFNI